VYVTVWSWLRVTEPVLFPSIPMAGWVTEVTVSAGPSTSMSLARTAMVTGWPSRTSTLSWEARGASLAAVSAAATAMPMYIDAWPPRPSETMYEMLSQPGRVPAE
jgi:hypothetical protein